MAIMGTISHKIMVGEISQLKILHGEHLHIIKGMDQGRNIILVDGGNSSQTISKTGETVMDGEFLYGLLYS